MNLSRPIQNAPTPLSMPLVPNARADSFNADPRLLEDPHQCIVLGHIALYKYALISDIELLIGEYAKKDAYDFQTFMDVWKGLRFSIIHMGCTEKHGREAFMNCIYQIFLSYLQDSYARRIQNAAVFGLYMIYFTQPFSFPKVGIRMTLDRWKLLEQFYTMACRIAETQLPSHQQQQQQQQDQSADQIDSSWDDVAYTIYKLREADAFLFVARDDPIGTIMPFDREDAQESTEMKLLELERALMTKSMDPTPPKIDELDKHDKLYQVSKQSLFATQIAQRAIERVQTKLQSGQPLRSMAGPLRARRLQHPSSSSSTSQPVLLAFDPLGHLDEQLQTLRGVLDTEATRTMAKGSSHRVHKGGLVTGTGGGGAGEGSSGGASQQDPTRLLDENPATASGPSLSTVAKGKARADAGSDLLDASTISSTTEPGMSAAVRPLGEGEGEGEKDDSTGRAKKRAKTAQPTSLFSSAKSGIAGDFEDLLKHHIKTRWKRLDHAVQGKLDSFPRDG
ncbi:Small nuclear RNA activating complex, polypeptide 1, 43kDa [Actinomortierella ambigua]|nr:Small nuclear RNA activating complex, polypeptide 1, 43kDa [Actinomortierella ambigua]